MDFIGDLFNAILITPLTNLFVLLTTATGNAGLAVILLTLFIRTATLPLYLKQMRTTRAMAALAPRIQQLQKQYTDPRRRSEEQMKLYREAGISPLGCFSSFLIQMPILFALYSVFRTSIGDAPEAIIELSQKLYDWDYLRSGMPLPSHFLWLDLGRPDPLVLPILVAASTYVLQKMTMMPAMDEKQRAQNSMMNLLMPLIFGWITISLPSGLGLYYVLSNLIGMVMQYVYVGRGPFNWRALVGMDPGPVLPRALEQRQQANERMSKLGASVEPEPAPETERQNGASSAARRRRRYSSGKRRGRR